MNSKDQSLYYESVIIINQDNKEYQLSMNVLRLEVVREVQMEEEEAEEEEVQNRERTSTQRVQDGLQGLISDLFGG